MKTAIEASSRGTVRAMVPVNADGDEVKLVAAMDRQHPRDIFDVMYMVDRFGWQPSFIDCFVAYLAGHNRPVHEVLFPKAKSLEPSFTNEFSGMSREAIAMDTLQRTQADLLHELPQRLLPNHRDFLLSLVRSEAAWDLMPFKHLSALPAVRWKLCNLAKLKKSSRKRFDAQHRELAERLAALGQRDSSYPPQA